MAKQEQEYTYHETEDYIVVTGDSSDPENPGECYLAVNRTSGVREIETKILPQIMDFTDQLQAALDKRVEEGAAEVGAEVIPFNH